MSTTRNLWDKSCREHVESRPLTADAQADLVVIGAGFTGNSAALAASRRGASVVLLEAERVAHGGSGRNVGLVNAGLWLPPEDVISAMGEAAGSRLLSALGEGPRTVFERIETHGIDCEATRKGTLHLAHSAAGYAELKKRCRQGNRIGAPLRLLDAGETAARTGSQAFHGSLLDPRAGTIQPRAYCTGLARAAVEAGARLHISSPATRVERGDGVWIVHANGHRVRAKALLLATNAYHRDLAGIKAPHYVKVAYSQFATAPLSPGMRERVLSGGEGCWDTAMVMSSFRLDREGRMIIGGVGNAAGPGAPIHANWARRKLRSLFPELVDLSIEFSWQGFIAMTSDHIPKLVEFGPSAYAAFGYSGRGIAPGTVIGAAAAEALLEDRPEAVPLPVQSSHSERFRSVRGAWYELGATVNHALPTRLRN
ncbi:FAD-dependent oxidoreductase [Fulvimarina sp. 2208YS6-2-32]|uniref:FAD-dependent oxidoreductase n=1 Tax=Fulvimarina uroteuthidis TaxID=3098149 RepID=A0ABU5I7C4_9HYPH|nr:FAD-dependent oxidoreductase [Fulvimarina sp. 2208YS6-2-32]MDY8111027.1 FAD-dependent oxidoreductase [Fulvimarina sp. 2208YS6-2-32]